MFNKKGVSNYIAAILLVVFMFGISMLYYSFITTTIEEPTNNIYHQYSAKQCSTFSPSLMRAYISKAQIDKEIQLTNTPELLEYIGDQAIASTSTTFATAWSTHNFSSYGAIYDLSGNKILETYLNDNESYISLIPYNNNYILCSQYYNGTNYELILREISSSGIVQESTLTLDEINQRKPALTTDGNYLYLVYVKDFNTSFNIHLKKLSSTFSEISDIAITNNTRAQYNPSIAYLNGKIYVAYEDYYNTTVLTLAEIDANTLMLAYLQNISSNAENNEITATSDKIAITYLQNNTLVYALWDPTLKKIISSRRYESSLYEQENPAIAHNSKTRQTIIAFNQPPNILKTLFLDQNLIIADIKTLWAKMIYANDIYSNDINYLLYETKDLFVKIFTTPHTSITLYNPSNLNITLTSMMLYYEASEPCLINLTPTYLLPKQTLTYTTTKCTHPDLIKIRLGTECGFYDLYPKN